MAEAVAQTGVAPGVPDDSTDLPMGPAGLTGLTPGQVAGDSLDGLGALGGSRVGHRLADDPTSPDRMLALQQQIPGAVKQTLPKVMVVCPKCGHTNSVTHGEQKCSECGTKLQHPEYAEVSGDESPFVGNAFSQATPESVLHLADSAPDDEDVATVGDEDTDENHPSSVECTNCGKLNPWDQGTCKYCGASLAPAKDKALHAAMDEPDALETQILHLTAEQLGAMDLADNRGMRMAWAKQGKALPDGSWPIPTVAYLKKACQAFPGRAKGQEGKIKNWIMKRAKALNATGIAELKRVSDYGSGTNASQPEHNATVVALALDHTQGENGLIWKVLCKTGTLALSPGPGQMDTEKPLNLTSDLFMAVKSAYDERAFEHVTIPETHENGTLENTGTVDALDVLTKDQALSDQRLSQKTKDTFAGDPADTLYMLGGLHFADPKVREKVANGSVLNCSVGLKFNYRRKRDGKLFPVALEHTALTNQPWVDGLGTFGGQDLSEPLFDQSKLPVWDGVFVQPPQATSEPGASDNPIPIRPENGANSVEAFLSAPPGPTSLPSVEPDGTEQTLEQLLASQQAEIERLRAENQEQAQHFSQASEQLSAQGRELHTRRVNERVTELQALGVPPSVLTRYKSICLAAYDAQTGGKLQLSVQEGDSTVTKEMGIVEQAEYLLAGMPLAEGGDNNIYAITTKLGADSLRLTQDTHERAEQSASEKADEVEKSLHPERFGADGKRLSAQERKGGQAA